VTHEISLSPCSQNSHPTITSMKKNQWLVYL
jgi:hypothetical protein